MQLKTTSIDVVEAVGTLLVALVILTGGGFLLYAYPQSEAIITLVTATCGAVVGFYFSKQASAQGAKTTNGTTMALSEMMRNATVLAMAPPEQIVASAHRQAAAEQAAAQAQVAQDIAAARAVTRPPTPSA